MRRSHEDSVPAGTVDRYLMFLETFDSEHHATATGDLHVLAEAHRRWAMRAEIGKVTVGTCHMRVLYQEKPSLQPDHFL